MPKSHRPYPPAFRRQMIELVRRGRTPEELARPAWSMSRLHAAPVLCRDP